MKRAVFATLAIGISFYLLNVPSIRSKSPYDILDDGTIPANRLAPDVRLGDFGPVKGHHRVEGIRGDIDRSVPFEVVPGEEFGFDLTLWNTEPELDSAAVAIHLDLPDGRDVTLLEGEVTLEGMEKYRRGCSQFVPEGLELYGRYTMLLFIDERLEAFFQFDLNSRDEIIVRWDDGVVGNAWTWYDAGNIWAIRGCMPSGAVIDEIGTHVISEGDTPFWPWPDAVHQAIELHLYDDDGPGGLPGTLLYTSGEVYADPSTGDVVALTGGIPAPTHAFYVGNQQLTDYPTCEAVAVDSSLDHPDQMFVRVDGTWHSAGNLLDGDLMIWAIGHMGGGEITMQGSSRDGE